MKRFLTTFLVAVMLLLGVFGVATASPDIAEEVPGVKALVAEDASAHPYLVVHYHVIGYYCQTSNWTMIEVRMWYTASGQPTFVTYVPTSWGCSKA